MSTLDAILPPAALLPNPFTGEVLDPSDLPALKKALAEIEAFLAEKRRENRSIYEARDRIQERIVALDPMTLPRPSNQTDKQRRVERCPRCKTVLPSEPEPQIGEDGRVGPDLGTAGTAPSGSEQSTLPAGPETPQKTSFDEPDFGQRPPLPEGPEQLAAAQDEDPGRSSSSPGGAAVPGHAETGTPDGAAAPLFLDPIIVQAGEVKITRGNVAGKTVAEIVEEDPERCLAYINGGGKDQKLIAAITTYMHAVRPDLMETR